MSQTVYVELAFSNVSLIGALPASGDPDLFVNGVDTGQASEVFTAPFALTADGNSVGYFQGNIAVVGATFTPPSNWATDITYVYPVSPLGVQEHIGIRQWLPVQVPDNFSLTGTPIADPGPTAGAVSAAANLGQTVDLTAAILAQVTPGVTGDTETITGVSKTSAGGVLTLTNGDLTYSAPNSSETDTFTYTVTDQLGDESAAKVTVTVSNPVVTSGGNVENVTANYANVSTGPGAMVVNLFGKDATVTGGNGNDTVNVLSGGNTVTLGTGTDNIVEAASSKGSNTFILNGSHASLVLYGANDVAFVHSGADTITDNSKGLEVKIGSQGGVVTLSNFPADKHGVVDLVGGVGGYHTAKAVVAALQSDGQGGTMLSLGASGHLDFANTAMASLTASHFAIG
ncbi:MAG: hypothetical protein WA864_21300 [Acetobacteraceae bacterium]